MLQGRRIQRGAYKQLHLKEPGDYGQTVNGDWFVHLPDGTLYRLTDHSVTENADHTITVHEPIYTDNWAGTIKNGIFASIR